MMQAAMTHSSSAGALGAGAVLLAGAVGIALIVLVGLRLGRGRLAESPLAGSRLAHAARAARAARAAHAASQALTRARDRLAHSTDPLIAAGVALGAGLLAAVIVLSAVGRLVTTALVVAADRPVDRFVAGHRVAAAVHVMLNGTLLGSYEICYLVAAITGLVIGVATRRLLPLIVPLGALWTEIVVQKLVHGLVHGSVPARAMAIGAPGGYFSGGSARALIMFGLLAYFAGWLGLSRGQRAVLWTAAAGAAFVEGYSRLYLGRHWAVDVIGGWLAGALLLAIIVFAVQTWPVPAVGHPDAGAQAPPRHALPEWEAVR
jgi:membrane-associated phospholipid phosphatase